MATPVLALRAVTGPIPRPLADAALELEEFARAGYVLERPVEADGLRLKPPVSRAPNMPQTSKTAVRNVRTFYSEAARKLRREARARALRRQKSFPPARPVTPEV